MNAVRQQKLAWGRLKRLPATFTSWQARQVGIAPRDLYEFRDTGVVNELTRGVFRKVDAPETVYLDLIAVTARAPRAVVCLESALAAHELIDDVPDRVHIAIPRGTHPPDIAWPPVRVSRFAPATFELGVEAFPVAPGEEIPVYGPARSVVDAMRLRHEIGESVALHAMRTYLTRADANPAAVLEFAHALRIVGPVLRTLEAVLA